MRKSKFILICLVLSLGVFTTLSLKPYEQVRKELTVAMDAEMPGYFLYGDENCGYQYDLLCAYADHKKIPLRVIPAKGSAASAEGGRADITATLASNIPAGESDHAVTLYTTSYVILTRRDLAREFCDATPFSLSEALQGKRLVVSPGFRTSKNYDAMLSSLDATTVYLSRRECPALIESLSAGQYDFLVCEKSEAAFGCALSQGITQVYEFAGRVAVSALFDAADPELKRDFGKWLAAYRNSQEYALLNEMYFESGIVGQLIARKPEGGISHYDEVIRRVSRREGHDWRLLSAIAYSESRFDPYLVSPRGARGLMQIMPSVARQFDVDQGEVMNPETNVLLAAKLLTKIERMLRLSKSAPIEDRICIILACYNGGIGHVTDARKLAAKYGGNPDSWDDVSLFLTRKADPQYTGDEVVKCGSFKGSGETLAFVDKVITKYNSYCNRVEQ